MPFVESYVRREVMVKCPRGCRIKRRSTYLGGRYEEDARLSLIYTAISKSGKTLYRYYQCPKCHRVFKRGHRISKWKGEEEEQDGKED